MKKLLLVLLILFNLEGYSSYIFIPMDDSQSNHLKAYGIAFLSLQNDVKVDWLLNYKGGSFLIKNYLEIEKECLVRGVSYQIIADAQSTEILKSISSPSVNQEVIRLEKTPEIAIYSPKHNQPWDDAVTLALTYAEIPYDVIYDEEVLSGVLPLYDWLHLHHEDFTGQYGKFYASFKNASWYKEQKVLFEQLATKLGFNKVSKQKLAVSVKIKEFINGGGFLFAMCSATDSYDIALAAHNTDICAHMFDGDPMESGAQSKLDYTQTLAFKDFTLVTNPNQYEFSNIDATSNRKIKPEVDFFTLFDFSAKWDPIPTMLCQNHTKVIKGFMGQTTSFNNQFIKSDVLIMGETKSTNESRYIHGKLGNGTWTFYGGHDPEDYQHRVGDPKTDLSLHPNSPGYRLILNNILFPAAKKKKQKT
ncbi:MAG: asparagine synthetase B [Flavobacteriales bacterium]|mgnify:CR=1 FL=1|nr:asparagine synthetase B [Flavobacteriales bacterium]|tara:strand:+ start:4180 stop:5433 length:1254 start_codon:yes stop_codon:yes gene_type:complete